MNLRTRAAISLAGLAIAMGLMLIVPAGTVRYWQAWVYLVVFIGGSALTTIDLMRHDPLLLERRMKAGPTAERRPAQRLIMTGASLGFIALLVVPALDFRFRWSAVPLAIVLAGDGLVAIGLYFISRVYRANSFTSATIEVAAEQKVVTTGPYAVVRHPMYASAGLYLFGTPIALASYWGLVAAGITMSLVLWRLVDEERFLARHLPGYTEYQRRVRYRLVPFVW